MLGIVSVNIDIDRFIRYLNSDALLDPENIPNFEKTFAAYLGAAGSFATDQGRSALLIALRSLHLAAGDEVIIQSFTWSGLIDIIIESGGTPVLADCSMEDCNAHNSDIEPKITEKTRAIIASHLFGIPCDIGEIADTARERGCVLIEDCAHAIGAAYRGRRAGTFGDLSFFSFHHDKPLTLGQGGLLAVNDPSLVGDVTETLTGLERRPIPDERCILYGMLVDSIATRRDRTHAPVGEDFGEKLCRASPEIVPLIGSLVRDEASGDEVRRAIEPYIARAVRPPRFERCRSAVRSAVSRGIYRVKNDLHRDLSKRLNSRNLLMNAPRAGMGVLEFPKVGDDAALRNTKARILFDQLQENESFQVPVVPEEKDPAFLKVNLFNNSTESLAAIGKRAAREGFQVAQHCWGKPVHAQFPYRLFLEHDRRELQMSEAIARRIINLPLHAGVNRDDLEMMGEFFNDLDRSSSGRGIAASGQRRQRSRPVSTNVPWARPSLPVAAPAGDGAPGADTGAEAQSDR